MSWNWTELTELLDTVEGKWDLGVLANLEAGPMRPAHLCRVINEEARETGHTLDPAVLSSTLKRMIEDGLVEHWEVTRFPRASLYSLTARAYEMVALLKGIDTWYAARRQYWQRQTDEIMHGRAHRLLSRPTRT